jgi:hypothetical protein
MSMFKSKHSGWTWDLKRTPFTGGGSGGGSSGPTQTNVQNTNIPEYARPYVETMLGTAQQQIYNYSPEGNVTGFKPYVPYGATVDANGNITNTAQEQAQAAVAPFSPLQQMSFYNAGNLGLPGQYNTGTGFAAYGGMGAANVANRAANVGTDYARMATNPYATSAYMSPYIQNALQPQLQEMNRQYDITGAQMQGKATGQGAFGGNRAALEQAENQRNKNIAMNQAIGTGYQNAFQAAQQAQQYGANLGLQGYGTALQGTGQLTNAGTALANIGSQQLQGQQGILGLQNQMGSQMQTQQQNMINQAIQNYAMQQQYPNQQLSFMSGLLRGLPLQAATTQSYQAAPSAISQLSGLGLTGAAAYGMMKKEGGIIKSYAEGGDVNMDPDGADFAEPEGFVSGGIAEAITNKVRMNPEGYSKQAIDKSTKNGLVDDIVGLAAIQEKNKNEKERMAQAAMMQPKPPTVKDQILAERAALDQQGIEAARSNLPTEYAGGGIVAFGEGGDVPRFDGEEGSVVKDNGPFGSWGNAIGEWWKNNTIGSPEALAKSGALTPEQAEAARKKQDIVAKQAEVSNAAYLRGDLDKPVDTKDNLTVVRDGKSDKGPAAPAAPKAPGLPDLYAKDAGGIDELIKQSIGDIKGLGKENADARKEAKLMAMLGAGLGIMGGTSPFAAANFKGAMPALQGYQEEMRGIRSDEAKQLGQIAALNLKGVELKQELKKLGISEQHYKDWRDIYMAKASGSGAGKVAYGQIPFKDLREVENEYRSYLQSPKTILASPLNSLIPPATDPKNGWIRQGLEAKVGSPSYNNAMNAVAQIAEMDKNRLYQKGALYGSKSPTIVQSSGILEP